METTLSTEFRIKKMKIDCNQPFGSANVKDKRDSNIIENHMNTN